MNMRRFSRETQRNYIRDVGRFATFLGRAPNTATAEDLRRFQVDQREAGVPVPRRCQGNGGSSTCSATAISRAAIYATRARHSAKAAERLCL